MEERPISFNLLHKDELEYEVKIRGGPITGSVLELKATAKKLNDEFPSDEILEFEGDVSNELGAIIGKLESLQNLLLSATAKPSLKYLNRVQALGHHLYHRLTRIGPMEESEVTLHDSLTSLLNNILHESDNLLINFKSSAEADQNGTSQPSASEGFIIHEHQYVHSLNITYNGKSCVIAFLQRLEEVRCSRGISDALLFNSACELFTGEACFWFRCIQPTVHSWTQIKEALLADYLPVDYDYRLLNYEIRLRTQGPDENIINYLSIMQNYFSKLISPISELEKLNIVKYNLRPFYTTRLALLNINTWDQLKSQCRLLEDASQRSKLFREPPAPHNNLLAPELAYKPPPPLKKQHYQVSAVQEGGTFCVRCRVDGHSLRNCKAPHFIICYRCGQKDVTAKNCPKCIPSKVSESKPLKRSSQSTAALTTVPTSRTSVPTSKLSTDITPTRNVAYTSTSTGITPTRNVASVSTITGITPTRDVASISTITGITPTCNVTSTTIPTGATTSRSAKSFQYSAAGDIHSAPATISRTEVVRGSAPAKSSRRRRIKDFRSFINPADTSPVPP